MARTNNGAPFDGQVLRGVDELIARHPQLSQVFGFFAFIVAYYVAYSYGMAFTEAASSPFWFPDSVLLCALLVTHPRHWWLLIVATLPIRFLSDVAADIEPWFLAATFVNDSAKGLLAAWALRTFMRNPLRFGSTRDFVVFCTVAVLLVPALSAFGGAAARAALGHDFWLAWEQWFMGNALTQLVVTPLILYWVIGAPWRAPALNLTRSLEACVLVVGLVASCYLSSTIEDNAVPFAQARFFAPLPFMFWAAIRFGMLGASGAVAVMAVIAVDAALAGRGPFSSQSPADTAFGLQNYLLLRSAAFFFIAALLERSNAAEVALDESETRFREFTKTAPTMLWTSDATGACLFVNQNAMSFTGRGFQEHLGTGWANLVHPDDLQRIFDTWAKVIQSPAIIEAEFRLRRHDGAWRWLSCVFSPRHGKNGELLGFIGSATDVTDNKEADELRKSVAHIQRLAAMGELTAAIAHEVKQPLTAMRSNVDAATHMLDEKTLNVKEIRETLADINSDSRLANEVLDRITRFMRKQDKRVEAVDLNDAVRDVLRLVKHDAELRKVRVEVYLADDLARVRGDRTQLMQVVMNLVVNAMDAMVEAPVDQRLLCVHTRQIGDRAEIEVRDCGSGITQQNLPHIFDSFFTTKGGGMGLGLSVSRSIVEEHGGQILAENHPEGGATFRFTVPFAGEARSLPDMQASEIRIELPESSATPAAAPDEIPPPLAESYRLPTADHLGPP